MRKQIRLILNPVLFVAFYVGIILSVSCGTEPTPTYTITTSTSPTEGGSVAYAPSGSPQDEGTSLTFTATPAEGYLFSQWQGDLSGSVNPATMVLNKNVSVTAMFEKRQYPLTIMIEGEGTVKEEILQAKTDYEHGTIVRLTPQAAEGWVFKSWSGDIESSEAVQEVTFTEAVNLTAIFEIASIYMDIDSVYIRNLEYPSTLVSPWIYGGNNLYYTIDDVEFVIGGGVDWSNQQNLQLPLYQLKRGSGEWEFAQTFPGVDFNEMRNYEYLEDGSGFLICDHGAEWQNLEWPFGHIYIGRFRGSNIEWTQVSTNKSFYHDCSAGDLNGDGLIDVVGGHLGTRNGNNTNPHIYIGMPDGTFEEHSNVEFEFNVSTGCCGDVEIYDFDSDGINEIIRPTESMNIYAFDVYEYDPISRTTKYEGEYVTDVSSAQEISDYVVDDWIDYGLGLSDQKMPTTKRFHDFNGDGKLDLVGYYDGGGLTALFAQDDGTYYPELIIKQNYYEMNTMGYDVIDLERDGDPDIIPRVMHHHLPTSSSRFDLSKIIYINDNGSFKKLSSDKYIIEKPGLIPIHFVPFVKNDLLHFRGAIGITSDNGIAEYLLYSTIKTDIPATKWYNK